jgi:hypothetical protein
VRLVLGERAPHADLGNPRAVDVLRDDLDPVPAVVRVDQQDSPHAG